MVAKIFYEFKYSRAITNLFLVFVLVGKSFLTPFFPLYLKYLRLSALEAGLVCGAQALAEMLLTPVWIFGVRRSRDSHKKRALIVISLLLTSALYVCFVFVPPPGKPDDVTHCFTQHININPPTTTVAPPSNNTILVTTSTVPPTTITYKPPTPPPPTIAPPPLYYVTSAPPQMFTTESIELGQPQVYSNMMQDNVDYNNAPQYAEPIDDESVPTSEKRRPEYGTWDDGGGYYDDTDPWASGRRLKSLSLRLDTTPWIMSPVFRAVFVIGTLSTVFGCLAEPSVSTLWAQRLDDAEHLEQRGEHVVWARFMTAVALTALSTTMTFFTPCFVGRGLHQTVLHPLSAAATLAGASLVGLIFLPLPSGKLPATPGPPRASSGAPISGLKRVTRGVATALAGAASSMGSLFLLWHVSSLAPHGFRHNYELLYGGFAALEALCAVPVLGWSQSPISANTASSPGRAALGLLVLAVQFGLAPLLRAPAPLPLLGVLQGSGGALLERSLGRAHASSSWRLGSAAGAVAAGVFMQTRGAQVTMWVACGLAIFASLAVVVTGRSPPSRRRRRAYSRLLLAETPSSSSTTPGAPDALLASDSGDEDAEEDWLERALREEDPSSAARIT